jgi:hypothetical protein
MYYIAHIRLCTHCVPSYPGYPSVRLGVSLDAKFNEGNTLLHFATALDMYDEVVYLLEAGANYLITNKEGLSPRDIALESGNQKILYLFRRESWYRAYTYADNPSYNPDLDGKEQNTHILSKIAQPSVGFVDISYTFWYNNGFVGVSENFLSWTDNQICVHLQDMWEQFRVQEQKYLDNLDSLKKQKSSTMLTLSSMHQTLRNHEHKICRKLFTVAELVRQYREKVNSYAEEKMMYKQEIQLMRKKIFFKGICQQRVHNGYLLKLWKYCSITVTGEYLIVADTSSQTNGFSPGGAVDDMCVSDKGDAGSSELDLLTSRDYCMPGSHRIPIKDIYYVEAMRAGPSVSFDITLKQNESSSGKGCRHLESIHATLASPGGDGSVVKVKLKKLTVSIPAVSLEPGGRLPKPKSPLPGSPDDASPLEDFPVSVSDITPVYFNDYTSAQNRNAHTFLLALRATSHQIKFGGNYLPPGWAAARRRSSAGSSSKTTPNKTTDPRTPSTGGSERKTSKKGKFESFFDRIFSSGGRDSASNASPCGSVNTPTAGTPPVGRGQADRRAKDRGSAHTRSPPDGDGCLSASENSDTDLSSPSTARGGTATSRESACTSVQSQSYSSRSSSSLPRMSTDSCVSVGRPSSWQGEESLGQGHAPYLETVEERNERQFSSDSEGQYSCKLAAQLAGIVAESVTEPAAVGYGLRRKRSSSSIASNADSASIGGSAAPSTSPRGFGGESPPPQLGWDLLPDMSAAHQSRALIKSVHYEDPQDGVDAGVAACSTIAAAFADSTHSDSSLAAVPSSAPAYDIEALLGPSLSRSKSLPFKLPSSDCLASCGGEEAGRPEGGDEGAARSLADVDAEELKRVTGGGGGGGADEGHGDACADWRSVGSDGGRDGGHSIENNRHSTEENAIGYLMENTFEDMDMMQDISLQDSDRGAAASGPAEADGGGGCLTTPEKNRPSFIHPLFSPCRMEGIAVTTSDGSAVKSAAAPGPGPAAQASPDASAGCLTPPSSTAERRSRADSGWGMSADAAEGEGEGEGEEQSPHRGTAGPMLKIFQTQSTEDSLSIRIKSEVTDSPTSLLVRATPDSPEEGKHTSAGAGGSLAVKMSPLTRGHRKSLLPRSAPAGGADGGGCGADAGTALVPVALCMEDGWTVVDSPDARPSPDHPSPDRQDSRGDSDDVRLSVLSVPGNDRCSAATNNTNNTDPPDDFGYFPDESFSHNSMCESDRMSHMFSSRYSSVSAALRDPATDRGEGRGEDGMLGLISDPSECDKPTCRMTISAFSTGSSASADLPPPRRISGLGMLPSEGIDPPSVLTPSSGGAQQSRFERASFCCGSATPTLNASNLSPTKRNAIDSLKKEQIRSSKKINRGMKFRTLEDAKRSLETVRDISAVAEERLSIALNDREVEHQKFTYLLALRGIVDHLPRVEDRVNFLSGCSGKGLGLSAGSGAGSPAALEGACDSPGGNVSYNTNAINSSHSATAILAAASASFAAATMSCSNTGISEEDGSGRPSLHSRQSVDSVGNSLDYYSGSIAMPEDGDYYHNTRSPECRVVSRDFCDFKPELVVSRKLDSSMLPSPLLLSSTRGLSSNGAWDREGELAASGGRLDSTSTGRLSSIDRDFSSVPSTSLRRSASRGSSSAVLRSSLGAGDRPCTLSSSPSAVGGFLSMKPQLSSEDSQGGSCTHSPTPQSPALMNKEYLTERFGSEIGEAYEIHALPPVAAMLCVPMGQPPDDLLDKYNM